MKTQTIDPNRKCPKCGQSVNQIKKGYTVSGTQRCMCKDCWVYYSLNPKQRAYSEETRLLAMKMYYTGTSGRGVGKVLGMSKANVYNWIKKNGNHSD